MNKFYLKLMLEGFSKKSTKVCRFSETKSNKNELECKNCGGNDFYMPDY